MLRADRVHDVDRRHPAQLPRPALENLRLLQQRADRADVGEVAGQLAGHRALEVGGDLRVLAAVQHAELGHPGDLLGEADAARALDAAGHRGLDHRAHIFVVDRALVLLEAREAAAIGHRLVLEVALAALVADRAVERVVDEQELHHPLARLLDHRGVGADRLAVGGGQRAAGLRLGRPGRDLDQAHPAIAGDRQPLVIAEARDLLPRQLARLEHGRALRNLELDAVDGDLRHRRPLGLSRSSRRCSMVVTRGPRAHAISDHSASGTSIAADDQHQCHCRCLQLRRRRSLRQPVVIERDVPRSATRAEAQRHRLRRRCSARAKRDNLRERARSRARLPASAATSAWRLRIAPGRCTRRAPTDS